MKSFIRGGALIVALLISACCAGGSDPYYCLASSSDINTDAGASVDVTDVMLTRDVSRPVDAADVQIALDVVRLDMPIVDTPDAVDVIATDTVDGGVITDVAHDVALDVVVVDAPIMDAFDAGTDTGSFADTPDVPVVVDTPDVIDVPVVDRYDAGSPTDVLADRPATDVVTAPDVVDVPLATDVPPPPDLVVEYNSGGSIPSSGTFPDFVYAYEGVGNPWPRTPSLRFTWDASPWWSRFTIEHIPTANQSTRVIYLSAVAACGDFTLACPSAWADWWVVIWHGTTYHASDLIAHDGGTVNAITLLPQSVCFAAGYNGGCVMFTVP